MSSVVNKSGTRFAPKIKQRRAVVTAPEKESVVTKINESTENRKLDDGESSKTAETTQGSQNNAVVTEEIDPLSQSTQKTLPDKETSGSANSALIDRRRRSSRLDSLSSASAVFKSGFMEPASNSGLSRESAKNRRLSNMAGPQIKGKKNRVSSISESDSSFQAIKKRRMSSRSSISRKTGSAQRISILSQPNGSQDHTGTAGNEALKSEGTEDLFQRTDRLYEKYTIANATEIPKNIADDDSSRYLLDEDNFTIADLCKPNLPIGETSDNFQRAQEALKAKQQNRLKRRAMRLKARENFKPLHELNKEDAEKLLEERKKAAEDMMNADIPEPDRGHNAIQLRISQDGTFAVDEESTVVDRHKRATLEHAHKLRMDENPFANLFNSATYGRQQYTDPWTIDELLRFYKALSMWGTDFNLIAQMFPYRTRRQIKAKFVNEEKKNPVVIELALRAKLPPDFDQYCTEIRKELVSLEDFNQKFQDLQKDHEKHLLEIEVSKQSAKEEDLQTQKVKEMENVNKKTSGGLRRDQLNAYRKTEVVLGTIDQMKKQRAQEPEEEMD